MKNTRQILLLLLLCMTWNISCRKDYLSQTPQVDTTTPVSFAADVLPIFTESCSQSGCHSAGGQAPDLTAANAYDQLFGLGYVDTSNAEGSIVYMRMISTTKPMPPAGKLSSDKTGKILAWIKQGGQNN